MSAAVRDGLMGVAIALVAYVALVLFTGAVVTPQLEAWQTRATDCWPRLP